jgi:hypothetical protein
MYGEDLDLSGDGQPRMDSYLLRIPAGTMADGAVVEFSLDDCGILTAVPRIPAPQPEGQP